MEKTLGNSILKLAVGLGENEILTKEQEEIYEEWRTGIALEYLKVDTSDPRFLDYGRLWDKLESKKEAVWEGIKAVHSLSIPLKDKVKPGQSQILKWLLHTKPRQALFAHLIFKWAVLILSTFKKTVFKKDTK